MDNDTLIKKIKGNSLTDQELEMLTEEQLTQSLSDGNTILHLAYEYEVNQFLLEMIINKLVSADLLMKMMVKNDDGFTPLHLSVIKIPLHTASELVMGIIGIEIIIKYKNRVEILLDALGNKAAELAILELDKRGNTLLHLAASRFCYGDGKRVIGQSKNLYEDITKLILKYLGIKSFQVMNLYNESACVTKQKPLSSMLRQYNEIVFKFLLESLNEKIIERELSKPDLNGNTLLHLVLNYDFEDGTLTNLLLRALGTKAAQIIALPNYQGQTPLHIAATARPAYCQNTNIMTSLVNCLGSEVIHVASQTDEWGYTPLHSAVKMKSERYMESEPEHYDYTDRIEMVKLLLRALGPKAFEIISLQNHREETPLHLLLRDIGWDKEKQSAVFKVVLELLDALGEKSPQILAQSDRNGNTPLHLAVEKGWVDVVIKFLDVLGPKAFEIISLQNHENETSLHLSVRRPSNNRDHLAFLLPKKTRIKIILALLNALAEKAVQEIARPDSNGDTSLHLAVNWGEYDNVKELLKCLGQKVVGIISLRNNAGETVLHRAAKFSRVKNLLIQTLTKNYEFTEFNLEGLDEQTQKTLENILKRNRQLRDLCLTAAKQRNFEKVKNVLEKGVNPYINDEEGNNLLTLALQSGNKELIEYLLENYDFFSQENANKLIQNVESKKSSLEKEYAEIIQDKSTANYRKLEKITYQVEELRQIKKKLSQFAKIQSLSEIEFNEFVEVTCTAETAKMDEISTQKEVIEEITTITEHDALGLKLEIDDLNDEKQNLETELQTLKRKQKNNTEQNVELTSRITELSQQVERIQSQVLEHDIHYRSKTDLLEKRKEIEVNKDLFLYYKNVFSKLNALFHGLLTAKSNIFELNKGYVAETMGENKRNWASTTSQSINWITWSADRAKALSNFISAVKGIITLPELGLAIANGCESAKNFGPGVAFPLSIINWGLQKGLSNWSKSKMKNPTDVVSELFQSNRELAEEIARKLTLRYQNQIQCLTEEGINRLADNAVLRISIVLLNGEITFDAQDIPAVLLEAMLKIETANYVKKYDLYFLKIQNLWFSEPLPTKYTYDKNWKEDKVYRLPGVEYYDSNLKKTLYYANNRLELKDKSKVPSCTGQYTNTKKYGFMLWDKKPESMKEIEKPVANLMGPQSKIQTGRNTEEKAEIAINSSKQALLSTINLSKLVRRSSTDSNSFFDTKEDQAQQEQYEGFNLRIL